MALKPLAPGPMFPPAAAKPAPFGGKGGAMKANFIGKKKAARKPVGKRGY